MSFLIYFLSSLSSPFPIIVLALPVAGLSPTFISCSKAQSPFLGNACLIHCSPPFLMGILHVLATLEFPALSQRAHFPNHLRLYLLQLGRKSKQPTIFFFMLHSAPALIYNYPKQRYDTCR